MKFSEWLKYKLEMVGTGAIVTKKDKKNPNFQIWGSMSNTKKKKN